MDMMGLEGKTVRPCSGPSQLQLEKTASDTNAGAKALVPDFLCHYTQVNLGWLLLKRPCRVKFLSMAGSRILVLNPGQMFVSPNWRPWDYGLGSMLGGRFGVSSSDSGPGKRASDGSWATLRTDEEELTFSAARRGPTPIPGAFHRCTIKTATAFQRPSSLHLRRGNSLSMLSKNSKSSSPR